PNVRLYQTDSSYVSLGDIYDLHCEEQGFSREEPMLFVGEKVRKVLRDYRQQSSKKQPTKVEYVTLKKDTCDEVSAKMVPDDVLSNYMYRTMEDSYELWRMRKQFALQIAACSFMTFVFCLSSRHPARFQISRSTGLIAMTELFPGVNSQLPLFATSDVVPFRLTPNMQHFLGPIFTEGVLASGIMAIGRSLTEPEGRSDGMVQYARPPMCVLSHIDNIVKRAENMACKLERENSVVNNGTMQNADNPNPTPVIQTVTNLISIATNPIQLAKMGELYQPWF
ncbi:hypothetical protein CVT26_012095, partial [Gymnopilus dilepis]